MFMRICLFFILVFISFPSFSLLLEDTRLGQSVLNENVEAFKRELESLSHENLLKILEEGKTKSGDNLFQLMTKVKFQRYDFALQMKEIIEKIKLKDAWLLPEITLQENHQELSLRDTTLQEKNIYASYVYIKLIESSIPEGVSLAIEAENTPLSDTVLFFSGLLLLNGGLMGVNIFEFNESTIPTVALGTVLTVGNMCYILFKDRKGNRKAKSVLRRQKNKRKSFLKQQGNGKQSVTGNITYIDEFKKKKNQF